MTEPRELSTIDRAKHQPMIVQMVKDDGDGKNVGLRPCAVLVAGESEE